MRRAASNPARSGDQNHGFPHLPWSKRSQSTRWLKKWKWEHLLILLKRRLSVPACSPGRFETGFSAREFVTQTMFPVWVQFDNKQSIKEQEKHVKQTKLYTHSGQARRRLIVSWCFLCLIFSSQPSIGLPLVHTRAYMWWSIRVKGWVCGCTEQHIKYTCSEQNMDSWSYSTSICCGGW